MSTQMPPVAAIGPHPDWAGARLLVLATALTLAGTHVHSAPKRERGQPAPAAASAATKSELPAIVKLEGQSLEGRAVSVDKLRGKVVMLYFWSTNCPVCRDKLPELRRNVGGWKGQPFELVAISLDRQRSDALAYQQTVNAVLAPEQRFTTLWHGDANYRDNLPGKAQARLPYTVVIDPQGRVAKTFEGRIPPDAWDTIAELLP